MSQCIVTVYSKYLDNLLRWVGFCSMQAIMLSLPFWPAITCMRRRWLTKQSSRHTMMIVVCPSSMHTTCNSRYYLWTDAVYTVVKYKYKYAIWTLTLFPTKKVRFCIISKYHNDTQQLNHTLCHYDLTVRLQSDVLTCIFYSVHGTNIDFCLSQEVVYIKIWKNVAYQYSCSNSRAAHTHMRTNTHTRPCKYWITI